MQITDAKVIAGRLSKVRDIMKSEGVDTYVVVTGDYHISEYAGDYFKEREFITGFTGSAGTAVITQMMQGFSLTEDISCRLKSRLKGQAFH